MSETTYVVKGMTCGHCIRAVTTEVEQVSGVEAVRIDLAGATVTVTGTGFTDEQIKGAVVEAGYEFGGTAAA
jgi:copper chaperone CopZ